MSMIEHGMLPSERTNAGRRAGIVGIIVNMSLFALKLTAGLLSGSLAVCADAVNNLSDAGSSIVTAVSFKIAGKPADKGHPWGHARLEYIAGLIVSFLVTIIGVQILIESVKAVFNPRPADYGTLAFAALVISVAAKIGLFFFYRYVAKRIDSVSLKAASADSLSDVLSTSAIIVGALISRFSGIVLDGWLGAAVAGMIIYSGVTLIIETSNPLIGSAPDEELIDKISEKIRGYEGVIGLHDLIIHNYGAGRCFASVHVEVPAERNIMESHDIIDNIENDFLWDMDIHLVIHLDPVVTDDERVNQLRENVLSVVNGISPELSMHDFRVVFGVTHTNLLFDLTLPINYPDTDRDLCHKITLKIRELDEKYNTVITVDRNYTKTVNADL